MKLYEISELALALIENKEEINKEDYDRMEIEISKMLKEKSSNIIKYTQNLEGDMSEIDKEIKRLKELKSKKKNSLDFLKKYIVSNMSRLGMRRLDTPLGTLSIRKSTKTVIDENKLPEKCFDFIQKRKTIKELEEIAKDDEKVAKCITKVDNENLQIK